MKTGAVSTKLRLTNIFGKASAATGAAAAVFMAISFGQMVGLIPGARHDDSYTRFGGDASYTETYNNYSYGRASWRDDLADSEISFGEAMGLFALTMGAGAAGIAAGRSRRRQIIDLRYDVIDVATGKPDRPRDGEDGERDYSAPRYESRDEYRRRNSYDDGFWAGWWMSSSGGRSRGGGFGGSLGGGRSSSSSKNNKNAGAIMAAVVVGIALLAAIWITSKSVKLNFFGEAIPDPEQKGEKPSLEPGDKPAFSPD